jgi:hypothetical protein
LIVETCTLYWTVSQKAICRVIRKLLPAVAIEFDVAPVAAEGELTDAAARDIEAAEAYFDKGGSGISHEEILREFGLG